MLVQPCAAQRRGKKARRSEAEAGQSRGGHRGPLYSCAAHRNVIEVTRTSSNFHARSDATIALRRTQAGVRCRTAD